MQTIWRFWFWKMWTNHQNSWRICAEHLRSEAAQFLSRVYAKLFVGRRWVLSALLFDFLASQRGHLLRLCTSQSHKQSRVPFAFLNISFLQAPLRRCGLIVSSPVQCFLPGWRFAEALFVVSRLDSTAAKEYNSKHFHYPIFKFCSFLQKDACKPDRSRQEHLLANIVFDTAENEPSKSLPRLKTVR